MSREKLEGTTSPEFTMGKGDHDVAGQSIAGIRTTSAGIFQFKNAGGAWKAPGSYAHVITVDADDPPGAIQAAIDSITGASELSPWCIRIMPGVYAEDVVLKDWVDLQGIGGQLAVIEGSLSWPATTCTDGAWSSLDNITIQNLDMPLGHVLVSSESGWHYLTNTYIYGVCDGTSAVLLHQSGGAVDVLLSAFEYAHTGTNAASGEHICVLHEGGIYDSFQSEYYVTTEDTANKARFYLGLNSGFAAGDICRLAYAPFYMATPAGFVADAIGFEVQTGATPVLVQNNDIRIEGTGGTGNGYAHSVKANASIVSSGNTVYVDGYDKNYRAYCEDVTSVLQIKYNSGFASDKYTGPGAQYVQYIVSGTTGNLEISGNLEMVASATVDGRDVSADGAALDGLVTHALRDDAAGQIHAIAEKATPADDDEVVIEDSADAWAKKRVKKSAFGGLSQHAIDSTTAHSAASDNTNFNASTGAHGFLRKLDDDATHFLNGKGEWVTSPAVYRYHEYHCNMTGLASNTIGYFSKAPPTTANPSGIPTTTPNDVYINGAMAPWLVMVAQTITVIDFIAGAAAVSQATVGATPTARIDVYNNLGGTGAPKRTLLGTYRCPVVSGEASIKNYNDASGTALIRFRMVLSTPLELTEGMLLGFEFVNETTNNTTINVLKAVTMLVEAVSIATTPTGYQLTIKPTAPTAPNTGDVWVDNS